MESGWTQFPNPFTSLGGLGSVSNNNNNSNNNPLLNLTANATGSSASPPPESATMKPTHAASNTGSGAYGASGHLGPPSYPPHLSAGELNYDDVFGAVGLRGSTPTSGSVGSASSPSLSQTNSNGSLLEGMTGSGGALGNTTMKGNHPPSLMMGGGGGGFHAHYGASTGGTGRMTTTSTTPSISEFSATGGIGLFHHSTTTTTSGGGARSNKAIFRSDELPLRYTNEELGGTIGTRTTTHHVRGSSDLAIPLFTTTPSTTATTSGNVPTPQNPSGNNGVNNQATGGAQNTQSSSSSSSSPPPPNASDFTSTLLQQQNRFHPSEHLRASLTIDVPQQPSRRRARDSAISLSSSSSIATPTTVNNNRNVGGGMSTTTTHVGSPPTAEIAALSIVGGEPMSSRSVSEAGPPSASSTTSSSHGVYTHKVVARSRTGMMVTRSFAGWEEESVEPASARAPPRRSLNHEAEDALFGHRSPHPHYLGRGAFAAVAGSPPSSSSISSSPGSALMSAHPVASPVGSPLPQQPHSPMVVVGGVAASSAVSSSNNNNNNFVSYGQPHHLSHQQQQQQYVSGPTHVPQTTVVVGGGGVDLSPPSSSASLAPVTTPLVHPGSHLAPLHGADPLLQEYKLHRARPTMTELSGHVLAFAVDSHGSRYLQSLMETASPIEREMAVLEVCLERESALRLMFDGFANYVVQNFIETAPNPKARRMLCETMRGSVFALSMNAHACRVVQKALDFLSGAEGEDLRNEFIRELLAGKANVVQAAKSPHGTHVLQKIITIIRRENLTMLLVMLDAAVAEDVVELLRNAHSYRFVLNVLGDCNADRSPGVRRALETIKSNAELLAFDQHGNFVLQHILHAAAQQRAQMQAQQRQAHEEECEAEEEGEAVRFVRDFCRSRVIELAQHKFTSHLIEKCLVTGSQRRCDELIEEILRPRDLHNVRAAMRIWATLPTTTGHDDEAAMTTTMVMTPPPPSVVVVALMTDPFGNFVMQKAMDRANKAHRLELLKIISQNHDVLSRSTFGRHFFLKHQQMSSSSSSSASSPIPAGAPNSPLFAGNPPHVGGAVGMVYATPRSALLHPSTQAVGGPQQPPHSPTLSQLQPQHVTSPRYLVPSPAMTTTTTSTTTTQTGQMGRGGARQGRGTPPAVYLPEGSSPRSTTAGRGAGGRGGAR